MAASTTTTTAAKRIVFTGGSGKAGRHAIRHLLSKGHHVLNLDLTPFPDPDANVYTLKTDLTDSGQVFNALSTHFNMAGFEGPRVEKVDAVIHFAAYARNMLVPDSECFRGNVLSTYNVIEAACKLGIRKVIIASSETVYGVCFAQGDVAYREFPLEEDSYDVDPMDTYATSKLCGERCARSFARRFADQGQDVYALRIGNVIEPHEYGSGSGSEIDFASFVNEPMTRKRNAWSYIDARDLGQICHLAVGKDGLGFRVFNATNDTATLKEPTVGFLKRMQPGVPFSREMDEYEAPLSNRKIKEVLGFREEHNWRKYVKV
ncbi:hypothetical protein MMC09_001578 [Bachmanniomyces sp. S44760]|nr:hypothetical protein [Bachmanniomyces sp. S44760]